MADASSHSGTTVVGGVVGVESELTSDAVSLLAELHRRFEPARQALLSARSMRQARFHASEGQDFRTDTRNIREAAWRVAPMPAALLDQCAAPRDGATMPCPRGWHLSEGQLTFDGAPMSASLFDVALHAFHNASAWHAHDVTACFDLGALQTMEEAALWDEVMACLEVRLDLPIGTMKATVRIDTLPAVFEMDEILHALRGRVVGLDGARRGGVSCSTTPRGDADRAFATQYAELLIRTCHRRGALAMGLPHAMASAPPPPHAAPATRTTSPAPTIPR